MSISCNILKFCKMLPWRTLEKYVKKLGKCYHGKTGQIHLNIICTALINFKFIKFDKFKIYLREAQSCVLRSKGHLF